ncbi:MAG: alkaline phosphatase PhoX [Sandaracinaceae bacterium]
MSRRAWFGAAGLLGVGTAVGALSWMRDETPPRRGPFGGLRPDPSGRFDLLEGFSYTVLDRAGRAMTDGRRVPARPDGMACFTADDGAWVLMRNHEIPAGGRFLGMGSGQAPLEAYDPDAAGGVTRLVLDPTTLEARSSNLVLAGTSMNCSGGPCPDGWITCEEDPSDLHGFAFLCDPDATTVQRPVRLDGFGRFRHEAAAMNPETGVTYLSEDRPDSCLYRFVPHDPASPFEGQLQAMRVRGRSAEDTAPLLSGARREIDWVDVRHPTPEDDTLRHDMQARGAAVIRRGEGICFGDGGIYLCATSGAPTEGGQIFRLTDEADGGVLEVVAASEGPGHLEMPDNVAMSPSGTLYVVEDGPGRDYLRGVLSSGEVFALGANAMSDGEIAGVCFSPDGSTMFLNLQEEGLTLAIRGPFAELV